MQFVYIYTYTYCNIWMYWNIFRLLLFKAILQYKSFFREIISKSPSIFTKTCLLYMSRSLSFQKIYPNKKMSRAWFLPTWIQAARKWHPRARRKRSVPCGWPWGQEDESSCRLVLAAERLAGFCSRCLFFQSLEVSLETNENWRWLNILNIMSCSPQAQTSKVSSMVRFCWCLKQKQKPLRSWPEKGTESRSAVKTSPSAFIKLKSPGSPKATWIK